MDLAQLALLALLIGVVMGGAVALVVAAAYRARADARAEGSGQVSAGALAVLAGLPDAAVIVDASGTVIAGSPSAGRLGLRVGQVAAPDQVAMLARAARAGTVAESVTTPITDSAGHTVVVAVHAQAMASRRVLLVLRDVTEQEQAQQMRRDFVQNVSHELKTPAAAVSLLAEAVEHAADDPDEVRQFAGRLQREGHRLATLTARIMRLSQVQSDEPLTVTEITVDDMVDAVIDAHRAQADAAHIELVPARAPGVRVRGDAQLLTDALGNLVANAIAFSPERSPVGIGVKADGAVVEISVTDRGSGIAESDQARVFERFYRADAARSRHTGGTGLGLAITKHAVQRHGGDVLLWSRPGQGSTFRIRLPQAVDAPPPPARNGKKRSGSGSGKKHAGAASDKKHAGIAADKKRHRGDKGQDGADDRSHRRDVVA